LTGQGFDFLKTINISIILFDKIPEAFFDSRPHAGEIPGDDFNY